MMVDGWWVNLFGLIPPNLLKINVPSGKLTQLWKITISNG